MSRKIIIRQINVGAYQVNCYLIACPETREGVIIDPGGDAEEIVRVIEEEGLKPLMIINTHGHADHVIANRELAKGLGIPTCMHEADDIFFGGKEVREASEKELGLPPPGPTDRRLRDGDQIAVGTLTLEVIHTPGHTPGSVCFLVADNLFTGDTLFVGDVGRTDLTGGSLDTLLESIKTRIIVLPGFTRVWPGHDYGETPTSTLDWEMKENPYITDFILVE